MPEVSITHELYSIELGSAEEKIENSFPVWDGIIGKETFILEKNEAWGSYKLELSKSVDVSHDVYRVEHELILALDRISYVWPFATAGWGHMYPKSVKKSITPNYNSNAVAIEQYLRDKEQVVRSDLRFSLGPVFNFYPTMPLETAIRLARETKQDSQLDKMLKCYHEARINPDVWYIFLYHIRDMLTIEYGENAQKILGITSTNWSYFGNVLNNNNLRHIGNANLDEDGLLKAKNELIVMTRKWIESHMRVKKLL